MKVTVIPFAIGALGTISKGMVKGQENLEKSEDHQAYSIIKISQNTDKSSVDLEEICCHSNSSGKPSANVDDVECLKISCKTGESNWQQEERVYLRRKSEGSSREMR